MKIEHVPLWLEQLADTIKREIAEALKQITDTIIRRQTIFIVCLLVLIAISNHDSVPPDGSEREPATPTTPASEASAPTDRALPTPKAEPAPRERPEIGTPVPDAKVDQAARNENSGVFVRIDFRGSNAILNTVRTHAVLYRRFGAEKLPVRKHSVAKRGDNFCTALADEIDKLFLSCPEVTSELWSSLGNQGSSRAITEGQLFSIPNIQVVRYEYRNVVKKAPAEAEATYGKLIHNSMALPVPDSTLLTLTGFAIRIYVSDIALALEVKSAVEAFDLPNTFPQIERSAANRRKPDLFSDQYAAPMDVEKECKPKDPVIVKEAASIVKEAAFWKSLDWLRDWQPPACALHCRSDNECVTINLIDQAVAPHWDLGIGKDEEENLTVRKVKVRIFEPEIPTADVPLPSPERCNVIDFDKRDEHHGTHIASILASRANGRSFIGLGSASKLRTYSLKDINSDEIANIVSARLESLEGPQIFVFASSFNTGEENPPKTCSLEPSYISDHLDSCDPPRLKTTRDGADLRKKNITVSTIDDTKAFWIVAAGQRESADSGYEIDSRFGVAPMNLGDFPNVLVVSACENCGVETEPNLWRKANYSSEGDYPDKDTRPERFRPWYVHVGAPGLDLFGPVDQYAQATAPGGTSEAAGFAGSVAAAMVNCYPGHFFMKQKNHIHYGLLKERLQLTSTPFPGGEENLSRISAGILDPAVALLDPTKHWVRLNDQRGWDGTDNPYYELKDPKWCAETISVSKIDDQRKRPLSTKNSYRIYRLPGGDEKAQWILYRPVTSDNLDHSLSQIRSLGPYFIDKPIPSEPLLTGDLISLKATTRRTLKVEEIADLVLAGRITRGETTCNP